MTEKYSATQKRALNSIWILISLIAFFYCSNYFVSFYGPETTIYDTIWKAQSWFLHSLIFAWYFYKNDLIKKGIIIQLLFIPYFTLRNDLYLTADYYLPIANSAYIHSVVQFFTFIIPMLYFSVSYFKNEKHATTFSKYKTFLIQLVITIVLSYIIESDVDEFYKYFASVSDSPYTQDVIVCFIFLLISIKTALVLAGFFYISNRIYSRKEIINPVDIQPISNSFFKWGFIISYTVLIMCIIDLGSNALRVSFYAFDKIEYTRVLFFLSSFFVLFVSGRFLGNLLQYRNYSLKKYFGVINALSLLPILNLISFFILLFSKKGNQSIPEYITKLKTKRNIHLAIYCVLAVLLICYGYFSTEAEYRDPNVFYKIPMLIIAVILLTRFRVTTKIVPFAIAIITYYEDIKEVFDFTKGYLFFIQDKIFSFLWLAIISVFMVYYVFYYIIHKSFYTEYFQNQDEIEFEENIKQFQ
ncbi:hypothetical protein OA93_03620 [Flavobacterium sp. KMS]|uniref:hypothetical protein n=1 Tax=Flavobacterium sp. KMS TaxID=1566023 RepID=UPI00057EA1DA|nr:hypothetical protein [Flavobacterium sp. KMS]KIA99910.1 hypothetical protein OA93_03620 [Flavobacterium sp. KMS]